MPRLGIGEVSRRIERRQVLGIKNSRVLLRQDRRKQNLAVIIYTNQMSHDILQTEGIVLAKRDFGEAERFFYIYTEKFGMVMATAQGVRLAKSKLRGNLDLFSYSDFSLVAGREIWRITDAEEKENRGFINSDSSATALFSRIALFLCRMIKGEERNNFIWEKLKNLFLLLQKTKFSEKELGEMETQFVAEVLHNLGYMENVPKNKKELIVSINRAIKESML